MCIYVIYVKTRKIIFSLMYSTFYDIAEDKFEIKKILFYT